MQEKKKYTLILELTQEDMMRANSQAAIGGMSLSEMAGRFISDLVKVPEDADSKAALLWWQGIRLGNVGLENFLQHLLLMNQAGNINEYCDMLEKGDVGQQEEKDPFWQSFIEYAEYFDYTPGNYQEEVARVREYDRQLTEIFYKV